jgi:hypothetical protein
LPILGATTETIIYANCRAELASLHGQANLAGMRYNLTHLKQDLMISAETHLSFNRDEMTKLYAEGVRDGIAGPAWRAAPPDIGGGAIARSARPEK